MPQEPGRGGSWGPPLVTGALERGGPPWSGVALPTLGEQARAPLQTDSARGRAGFGPPLVSSTPRGGEDRGALERAKHRSDSERAPSGAPEAASDSLKATAAATGSSSRASTDAPMAVPLASVEPTRQASPSGFRADAAGTRPDATARAGRLDEHRTALAPPFATASAEPPSAKVTSSRAEPVASDGQGDVAIAPPIEGSAGSAPAKPAPDAASRDSSLVRPGSNVAEATLPDAAARARSAPGEAFRGPASALPPRSVRVQIGRVVVRAPPPAPPPSASAPKAAPLAPRLSLREYLERRSGPGRARGGNA